MEITTYYAPARALDVDLVAGQVVINSGVAFRLYLSAEEATHLYHLLHGAVSELTREADDAAVLAHYAQCGNCDSVYDLSDELQAEAWSRHGWACRTN